MDNGNLPVHGIKQENSGKRNSPVVEKKVEVKREVFDQPEVKEEFLDNFKEEAVEFENYDKEPELTIDMPAKTIVEACK